MLNCDESLFLMMECRTCGTEYVFWRGTSVMELEKYGMQCCRNPKMRGVM